MTHCFAAWCPDLFETLTPLFGRARARSVLRAAGLPENLAQAKFMLWLRSSGLEGKVDAAREFLALRSRECRGWFWQTHARSDELLRKSLAEIGVESLLDRLSNRSGERDAMERQAIRPADTMFRPGA